MEDQNTTNHYEIHPVAYIFPRMSEEEFEQLKNDIDANGQQAPILLHEGKVVDGRHRLRACQELGIAPMFDVIEAANDQKIEQVVVSINLHRRHLTDAQKALIAARLANLGVGANQHTAGAVSQKMAAKELGISVDSVQRGKQVLLNGVPQLISAVESGDIDITNASRIAKMSRDEQVELTAQDKKIIREASKAINRAEFEERRQERLRQIEEKRKNNRPLDTHGNTYSVIYADPPWDYMGEEKVGYPCMSVEEICKEPVNTIAEEDAALFMWCSSSLLADAIEVIKAWGFKLKTSAVWDKGSGGHALLRGLVSELQDFAPMGADVVAVFPYPLGYGLCGCLDLRKGQWGGEGGVYFQRLLQYLHMPSIFAQVAVNGGISPESQRMKQVVIPSIDEYMAGERLGLAPFEVYVFGEIRELIIVHGIRDDVPAAGMKRIFCECVGEGRIGVEALGHGILNCLEELLWAVATVGVKGHWGSNFI